MCVFMNMTLGSKREKIEENKTLARKGCHALQGKWTNTWHDKMKLTLGHGMQRTSTIDKSKYGLPSKLIRQFNNRAAE